MTDGNKIYVNMEAAPPRFPNYLRVRRHGSSVEETLDVGDMPLEQAEAYWDWCKQQWMQHVQQRKLLLAQKRAWGE